MTKISELFLAGLAAPDHAIATLRALEAIFRQEVGVKLFTVMEFDAELGLARRLYSSDPENYPVSGSKPLTPGPWSQCVIDERKLFVANDIDAIADVFPDFELIRSLGCESVVNVPAVFADEVIGTVNILHGAGYYTAERRMAV